MLLFYLIYKSAGLRIGDPVIRLHKPLSAELGPGIMGIIYDGIQRPLDSNPNIYTPKGIDIPSLNRDLKWYFTPLCKVQLRFPAIF